MSGGAPAGGLETERLILRPFRAEDRDAFAALFTDPEVIRFLGYDAGDFDRARRELEHWMEGYARRGFGMMGVFLKDGGALIGRCGFAVWDIEGRREVELDAVFRRACWGRGLATEAAAALRDFGFRACGFDRLVTLLHPDNAASIRVAEKLGMAYEKDVMPVTQRLVLYSVHRTEGG